jgi:uncharacterized protein YndB with AHSA1/START domain
MLKVILGIVVLVAAAIGCVAWLGSRLPVAHVATRSVTLPVPPDTVFATITDFASAPAWRKDVQRVDLVADGAAGRPRFTEVSRTGSMTMEVILVEPPARLVTQIVGEGLPFGGAWAYRIAPEGTGSRVTITEHGEVYNPVFRFVSRYVMGHASTIEAYLTALSAKYGVEATPFDAPPVPIS